MVDYTQGNDSDLKEWEEFVMHLLISEPRWIRYLFSVVLCCIFVVSVIGNLLTCIVIYTDKTMHTATNFYLFNLAVSDLIVTFAMPLEAYVGFFETDRTTIYALSEVACKVNFFLILTLWNNGILILTALAVERYLAICHPLTLKSVPVWRRVVRVILGMWILAIAESLPEIWYITLKKNKKTSMCFMIPTQYAKYLNGVLAVVTFLIPLGIMVFVYSKIAFKLHLAQKYSGRHKIFNHRDNRSKVNKLIVALTLSFMVCWLPFFVSRVIMVVMDMKQIIALDIWWIILYKIIGINGWFSSVLNPLLFSLMSTKFRKALKTLWNRKSKSESGIVKRNRPARSTAL